MGKKPTGPKPGRPQRESPEGFPLRLRQSREKIGLTITDAAAKIGVHKDTWACWESGQSENLRFDYGLKAAELLQVDPHWLAFGDD